MKAMKMLGIVIAVGLVAGAAMAFPLVLAYDEAGNYTPGTFIDGANEGFGFGAWDLWNTPASLGDSTAGGGGDLNSTNGYSFQFMGDGAGGWCNGKRNLSGELRTDDVLSFTFTYNYDGGNRGVDVFCSTGQFANVIDVSAGNSFKVNGTEISTEWSPGAVVAVDITQLTNGVQVHLTRETNGTENLNYTTNILNPEAASGFSLYCGGYTTNEFAPNNVDFAIFMNNIKVMGEPRTSLTFTGGTWDPSALGDYPFELTREGTVGDEIVLSSDNELAVTVPASVTFVSNSVAFNVTVVSLTAGPATIIASNTATGVWTDYGITPAAPSLAIDGAYQVYVMGPQTYTLTRVGAVGDSIQLTSSDTGVMTVPTSVSFLTGEPTLTFDGAVVATGTTTLTASNTASGASAEYNVTVSDPRLELTGPATAWVGDTKTYTVRRYGPVADTFNLASSDTGVMTVPASVDFPFEMDTVTFQAEALAAGNTTLSADNDDVAPATLAVTVTEVPTILAYDEAGNYTPATFINGANEGFGFGEWNLWGTLATLGDSTAGGGGDLNSTNGYSFQFMGDGAGGWCNGTRYFDGALQEDNVMSFTFTYNYDGGQRGVDIFCSTGQFANAIDVSGGNSFKVNGTEISTDYSPGAVVDVEITQQAGGIQMSLVRSVDGVPNLTYTTNILNPESATGVSMYCGGYTCAPEDNVNYAIFMNDLQIAGEERTSLTFSSGTWNPSALGDYSFELTRSGAVDNEIVLTSDNTAAVTVPASVTFAGTDATVSFMVTVVSLTNGDATVVASNAASGLTATYTVKPYESTEGPPFGGDLVLVGGDLQFTMPTGYTLGSVLGADCALVDGDWDWQTLSSPADYTVEGNVVTITATGRKIIRIGEIPD